MFEDIQSLHPTITMVESKVSLKLLVDKRDRKVLFAEANKDFVDFLLYIFRLPVGAVIRLLASESMVGSLGDLYNSIENLGDIYMEPNKSKDIVLNPKLSTYAAEVPLLLPNDSPTTPRKFYMCSSSYYCRYIADDPKSECPNCRNLMSTEVPYVARDVAKGQASAEEGGFVKGVVTYMITDNLAVKPMSTISTIALLNKLNIKDVCNLREREVHLGMAEGLKLLKASLECKNVLTSVFLGNMDDVEIV